MLFVFDYGHKGTAFFLITKIFLTFLYFFSFSANLPIYAGFFALFVVAHFPVVVVCSVGVSVGVLVVVVCPDDHLPAIRCTRIHTRTHTHAHTHARGFLDRNF